MHFFSILRIIWVIFHAKMCFSPLYGWKTLQNKTFEDGLNENMMDFFAIFCVDQNKWSIHWENNYEIAYDRFLRKKNKLFPLHRLDVNVLCSN